jgi:hypothetical protein
MCLNGRLLGFTLFIYFFVAYQVTAQDEKIQKTDSVTGWDAGGTFGLNFSESSFSNWNAGGTNSLGLNGILKPYAKLDDTLWTWDNALDLRFGLVKTQGEKLRKSDDLILLTSKLGRKISEHWEFSGLFTFRTQFAPSYRKSNHQLLSDFMAPGYMNLGLGFNNKPNEFLSIYLSPLTNRTTYVLNDSLSQVGEFGVAPGKKAKRQLGFSTLISYKQEVIKNVGINTDLSLFSDYLDEPQNIVVLWDFVLTLKANKFLSTTFSCALIYDDNVTFDEKDESGTVVKKVPKVQFKQVLGVGISVGF